MTSNMPEIRFEGFDGEWGKVKLGETCTYVKGNAFKSKDYQDNGIRVIRVSDLTLDDITEFGDKIFVSTLVASENKKYKILKDEIIITTVGSKARMKESAVGRAIFVREDKGYLLNQNLVKISIKQQFYDYYIYIQLSRLKYIDYISKIERGNANQANIAISDLWNYYFITPNTDEQQAIGSFFKELDDRITLQQTSLERLKETKQGFLQKIFPKNGETVPEIRFDGFDGEWQLNSLEEIANLIMGQSPSSENYTNNPLDNILVQGNADLKNGYVVPRVWTTEITKLAEPGDLIMSVRAPVGDMAKTNYQVVLGRGVCCIKGNEFLYQCLKKMKKEGFWTRLTTGSTFESISSIDIKKAAILEPSLEEQQVIGSFFKELDDRIAIEERELELLKETKKAFLQKMFV